MIVMKIGGSSLRSIESLQQVTGWDRLLLARWVRSRTKVSVKWLAQRLGMQTRGGMSNGIYLAGRQLEGRLKMQQRWRALEALI